MSEFLNVNTIEIDFEVKDKEDSIRKIIQLAAKTGKILDIEKVTETIFQREEMLSTGIGRGIAVPHGKSDSISEEITSLVILKNPIDFNSIDKEPVRIIFLLIGKDTLLNVHIKLLSRICRLFSDDVFKNKLLNAKTKEEIIELFKNEEKQVNNLITKQ